MFCPPSLQARIQFFSFLFISGYKEPRLSPPLVFLCVSVSFCISNAPLEFYCFALVCLASVSPICCLTCVEVFSVPLFFSPLFYSALFCLPPYCTLCSRCSVLFWMEAFFCLCERSCLCSCLFEVTQCAPRGLPAASSACGILCPKATLMRNGYCSRVWYLFLFLL